MDQIRYAITNGQVPATTDPMLRGLFERQAAAAQIDPVVKARFGVFTVLTVLLAGPVIAVAAMWFRRKQKKERAVRLQ